MLLAAELIHVMNCSPYIRGESIRLIGWHRLWVSVCMCFYLRLCLTTELGKVVCAMVSKCLWVGGKDDMSWAWLSACCLQCSPHSSGVWSQSAEHISVSRVPGFFTRFEFQQQTKSVLRVALRKKNNNLVQLCLWEWKLVLKLLK